MVNALTSKSSGPGSSPSQRHCAVFLGKTLYCHSASLHLGDKWVLANVMVGTTLQWASIAFRREQKYS